MLTLVEDLQPFFIAQPPGYTEPAKFYMTINKTTRNQWSAGYQDYGTLLVLLAVNNCESLEEVAIRLAARLERYIRLNTPKPRKLYEFSKDAMVGNTNLIGDNIMADENSTDTKKLTYGGKAVGLSLNPSALPEVDDIKKTAANFIDTVCGPSGEKLDFSQGKDNEAAAMRKLAMRAAQEAQMWAVKAATWELN